MVLQDLQEIPVFKEVQVSLVHKVNQDLKDN